MPQLALVSLSTLGTLDTPQLQMQIQLTLSRNLFSPRPF
jgi:hypothetical protein